MRVATVLLTAMLASCGSRDEVIVVGSKNFSENVFLGELIAQAIESSTEYRVERRLNLGGTFLCHQALTSGALDVYPEYSGTALTAILELDPIADRARALAVVEREYRERFDLVWGRPFGFNNTFAVLVRDDAPAELRTISDLTREAGRWTIGFNFEFLERRDGFDGLREAYGLRFAGEPRTMDLSLVYQALRDEQIDVAIGNSTHGLIDLLRLRQLDDDRNFFPPYDAAAVVRAETLERFPKLRQALERLAGSLTQEKMRAVNRALDVDGQAPAAAAADLLADLRASGGRR